MENLRYYPDEIAEKLCYLANEGKDGKIYDECTEALYQLLATAQNPYNADYYRTLYKVLEEVAGMED